jgi:DNA-directed RNA polymerase subunit RPC12/RpoP
MGREYRCLACESEWSCDGDQQDTCPECGRHNVVVLVEEDREHMDHMSDLADGQSY